MGPPQNTGCRDETDGARIEAAGILLYLEDFEPKLEGEFGRQPKLCNGLKAVLQVTGEPRPKRFLESKR